MASLEIELIYINAPVVFLQNPEDNNNRLKRWIMIGDHHQLPPVIKNMAFQKFSNMEQSLFTRLVRLGVPTVDLDAQGRARARYGATRDSVIVTIELLMISGSDNAKLYNVKSVLELFFKGELQH